MLPHKITCTTKLLLHSDSIKKLNYVQKRTAKIKAESQEY